MLAPLHDVADGVPLAIRRRRVRPTDDREAHLTAVGVAGDGEVGDARERGEDIGVVGHSFCPSRHRRGNSSAAERETTIGPLLSRCGGSVPDPSPHW